MRRHLIAGAFACFGSSLFGQTTTNPANQIQGTLNNVQNTLQNGIQKAQDSVDRNVQQSSGASVQGDVQNRSSVNSQSQVNGTSGVTGDTGVQSNANLQNRLDRQPGQLNSNLSTQVQGQSTLGGQQRNGVNQGSTNQDGSVYQPNGNNGVQSPAIQRQGQAMQSGQSSSQVLNSGASQAAGPVYMLRFDSYGREFICVDGRPVYFDNVNSMSAQGNSGTQNQYRSGYGSYDLKNDQNTQNQFRKEGQLNTRPQTSGSVQNSSSDSTSSRNTIPGNLPQTTNSPEVAAPDRERSNAQNELQGLQKDAGNQSNFDANSDIVNPNKTINDVTDPKS